MKKLKIVFMGTPGFAVGILDSIVSSEHEIVAVVTVADKPAGRGQKVGISAVKEYALEKNIPVLQPVKLKDEGFLSELKSFDADIFVIVAFRMLPREVWAMPEFGTFNLHASLLPQYRGAAPINWAVINGETTTGVTTFFIDDKIDTGATLLSAEISIGPNETAGELHDRLMELGSETVLETLDAVAAGNIEPKPQPESLDLKPAPKLDKENCKIDWSQSGKKIHNQIRGLSPYPAAWTFVEDKGQEWSVKIYASRSITELSNRETGSLWHDKKNIYVAVGDGIVAIDALQFPGKKKMTAAEFLNGFSFSESAIVR
ncbi:methionyl-tRNA formyltransferase [Flavobacterium silvaticum]|uniref:Methionyl-tRNA formyltransferase n=1 Tax=Flavobacterium silvaticum TaxID=1852020 RepID=A0A972JHK9_9FLAO|nr:methionyl-tRNA formyltransferase [Flavobacterium silvaticum]NMH28050.1 methionyl-tRNA formyltransferase [Flavobacterium silvaticum]